MTAQLRHRNYDRTDSVIGWMGKLPYVRHEPTSIVFVSKVVQRYCQFQNKVAGTRSPEWGYPSHHGFTTETVSWLGWFGASLSKETLIPAGFISYLFFGNNAFLVVSNMSRYVRVIQMCRWFLMCLEPIHKWLPYLAFQQRYTSGQGTATRVNMLLIYVFTIGWA